jgi:ankyrin repeat protein
MSEAMQALFAGDRSRAEALLPADDQLTLHQAAAFGRVGRIEEILAADPEQVNELSAPDGFSALHLAIFGGQDGAMRALIAHGADLDVISTGSIAQVPPLGTAIFVRSRALAKLLLDAGAHVNTRYEDGSTVLHAAALTGDEELIRLLLAHGADPAVRNGEGKRPQDLTPDQRIRSLLA